jgi:FKBP-type peptidyl-prolyl cis-trans isomerase FkpA
MKKLLFSGLVLVLLGVSCAKKENEICNYNACQLVAPAAEVTQVEAYLTTNTITATKHCSGLYYRIETAGSGKTPGVCNQVVVRYKGSLTNGTIFDQSATAQLFNLGTLIEGWKKGLGLLKEGGKIHLYVPPSLGYGPNAVTNPANGATIIPANSILVFEVNLDQVI